jgi:hypothetical protein
MLQWRRYPYNTWGSILRVLQHTNGSVGHVWASSVLTKQQSRLELHMGHEHLRPEPHDTMLCMPRASQSPTSAGRQTAQVLANLVPPPR